MKLLMFDFDGVIADTFEMCWRINNLFRTKPLTPDEYRALFKGNIYTSNDDFQKLAEKVPVDTPFFLKYAEEIGAAPVFPGMIDATRRLAGRADIGAVIISSTVNPPIASYLAQHGIDDCFLELLGADVEKSKVKKIRTALDEFNVAPTDAVFITDTLGDIREAAKVDVRSVAVSWGFHERSLLEDGRPYAIADTPDELEAIIQNAG